MRASRTALAAVLLAIGSGTAGCGAGAPDGQLSIVAAFYPLQHVAEQLANAPGDDRGITVSNLVKPGVEPHDLELTPSQIGQVAEADLLIYLKGFQPAIDEAVAQHLGEDAHGYDVMTTQPPRDVTHGGEPGQDHEHGAPEASGKDPHVWLDPTRYAIIADHLAEKLGKLDPDDAAGYTERAERFGDQLRALDKEYANGLADCQRREIVVSHAAFGYLTDKYRLTQIPVAGLSPEQQPTPRRLTDVIDVAREHGATVIFFETLASPKVAKTIAAEVGAQAKVLDPIEGRKPGSHDDYFSLMRGNLSALRSALDCS